MNLIRTAEFMRCNHGIHTCAHTHAQSPTHTHAHAHAHAHTHAHAHDSNTEDNVDPVKLAMTNDLWNWYGPSCSKIMFGMS